MNKTFKRVLTIALALTLCLSLAAPAFAIKAAEGKSTALTVYSNLIVDENLASWPTATATITVTAVTGTGAADSGNYKGRDASTENIKVGGNSGNSATVTFNSTADASKVIAGTAENVAGEGNKYTSHGVSIDFEGCSFPEPGVYHYKVTQAAIGVAGYSTDVVEYEILVYVDVDETTGETEIGSIVVPDPEEGDKKDGSDDDDDDDGDSEKDEDSSFKGGAKGSINFNNYYGAQSITLKKFVTGNQGSRTEAFTFNVTLTGTPGDYYITSGEENTSVNAEKITIPDAGTVTATITLKDSEYVVIAAVKGVKYQIVEQNATDYTTVIGEAPTDWSNPGTTSKDTGEQTLNDSAVTVTFNNHKEGTIPNTGVLLTIAPFVLLMIVGIAGVTIMMKKRYE